VFFLWAPAARAVTEEEIQKAFDQGVNYLRGQQGATGLWPHAQAGATSLAALTLLECGVPPGDPAVQRAANAVRQSSLGETQTYSLALAVMFLDRLGDPGDIPLIESLAVRLLAGQQSSGGWNYNCPPIGPAEARRLGAVIQQRNELVAGKVPARLDAEKLRERPLPKEIQDQLKLINRLGRANGRTDNSNTQFATLGLWVARRYGLPVDRTLLRVYARFLQSQNADGGWGYVPEPGESTAPMTCAGLLGLAVGHGVANDALLRTEKADKAKDQDKDAVKKVPDPAKNPAVRAAFLGLAATIGRPTGKKNLGQVHLAVDGGRMYYFLWSLERVAVAYGLKTIGKKDWYGWGAEVLLVSQRQDGSWQGEFGAGGPDTCFGLLFLRKANLAADLSATLKGKVQDPGEINLKAGGVGGEALQPKGPPAGGFNIGPKPGDASSSDTKPGKPPARPQAPVAKENPSRPARPKEVDVDAEAARLSSQLVQAPEARQNDMIERFKEGKGLVYTQALAEAIPRLNGPVKEKVRDALAERLMNMTAPTLRGKMKDEDPEIRRAAALACAMKEEAAFVPDLIALLEDPQPTVGRAAHAALKSLTGQKFGPPARANAAERAAAVAQWKAWWDKQSKAGRNSGRGRDG
jgi:hypothetical protein